VRLHSIERNSQIHSSIRFSGHLNAALHTSAASLFTLESLHLYLAKIRSESSYTLDFESKLVQTGWEPYYGASSVVDRGIADET
jgi:hypothetical protein